MLVQLLLKLNIQLFAVSKSTSFSESNLNPTANTSTLNITIYFSPNNTQTYFNSKTLRNFALFIRSYTKFKDNTSFEEILSDVKDFFKNELTKEKMQARLVQNVKLEKNIFVRIIPLFIKKYAMRLGYKLMASTIDTMNFSNLGIARCPEGFENYVERFEFVLGASKSLPMNASSISYNNTFVLSLSISTLERELPRCVINQLVKDGIDITIETNDLEVQDEEM